MGVAKHLGVDDLESPLMVAARAAWPEWCANDPALAVVDELRELPAWTLQATRSATNAVLGRLAALTELDSHAPTVLAWLLVPGASRIAADLADLHGDVDALVAGQLWIEARHAHQMASGSVASGILRRTRNEVCVELGVGEQARRRDRVWVESMHLGPDVDVPDDRDPFESEVDPFWEVTDLMIEAMEAKAIHVFDAWLLGELARRAADLGVSGRRGRMGLTAPAVIDELSDTVHLSARAIRRRAATALDRFAEFVRVRDDDDAYAVWRAQHTTCPVTPAEEMQLVLTEDGPAQFFRVRDLPPDAWAPDVAPERRRPKTG